MTLRLASVVVRVLAPAQDRANARDEFSQPVGLGDVVVSADLEHQDHVDLFALGAHDDDGHVARSANRAADVETGHFGQHQVE